MNAPTCGFTVRPMREADLDAILVIEGASFPKPWTRDHFLHELASDHAFPLVAVSSTGMVGGYICPTLLFDEAEILDVAVRPDLRGQGIGEELVARVLDTCRDRGAAFVALEVRRSNAAAIRLYERLGFVQTGERRNYYENGDDAVLMRHNFREDGDDHAV